MDGVIIYAYTRAQAIEDGVLKDISPLAREAGFQVPVAVTHAVWQRCIEVPAAVPWQDVKGRAWDILMVLRVAALVAISSQVTFRVAVQNECEKLENVELKALIGPGDHGEPVITVMFTDED